MDNWNTGGGYNFGSDELSDDFDYMKGLDGLAENFDDIDGLSDDFDDSGKSEDLSDEWTEDLDLSIDMFGTADFEDAEDVEMAEFEKECARRLAAEHARQAAEANRREHTANPTVNSREQSDMRETDDIKVTVSEQNAKPEINAENISASSELSQMMRIEAYQQQRHEDDFESSRADDEITELPTWLRILFSVILIILGAVGVWLLTANDYNSYLLDPLCFTEVALCLMTAVGINAALISDRSRKTSVMRIAMWCVFLFYCLYAADTLFLDRLLELRFNVGDFTEFARSNISFDIFGDLSRMGGVSIVECMVFIIPYAFCVPVLIKSYRNIFLYFLYITFSVLVAGTLRIITLTGGVSITQCLMCLIGAAAAYIVFMLPPMQNLLRSVGLLEWIEVENYDEYTDL